MARHRTRTRWTATRDGIAHAHWPGLPRTLCGEPVIEERFGWPVSGRCPACLALEADLRSPATETENRMLWGDR